MGAYFDKLITIWIHWLIGTITLAPIIIGIAWVLNKLNDHYYIIF